MYWNTLYYQQYEVISDILTSDIILIGQGRDFSIEAMLSKED
ncbi:hypothetical protein [Pantoea sp. Mhis]|nr:hypothetical protein [Pantoea sp. Mhis]